MSRQVVGHEERREVTFPSPMVVEYIGPGETYPSTVNGVETRAYPGSARGKRIDQFPLFEVAGSPQFRLWLAIGIFC